jgi:peptide/nickel transport system permease protein
MRRTAFVLLFLIVFVSIFAGILPLKNPNEINLERRLESPSFSNPLGTDELGRDLLSRILWGSRISIKLCAVTLFLAIVFGGFLGGMAGFSMGVFDFVFSRVIDLLLSLPGILLSILILAFFKRGELSLIIALSLTSWINYAKTSRVIAMKLRRENFVESALAGGAGKFYAWRKHIFPNVFPVLATQATVGAAGIIMTESALSFLGVGLPPPTPTIGGILSNGCDYIIESPHIVVFSSMYLLVFLWSLYKCSDVLQEKMV